VEVEGGADADEHGSVELRADGGHPLSCLGTPMPDPDDVGARAVDLGQDRVLLLVVELAERRRVAPDDLHPGVAAAQVERELHERALVASPVQEHLRLGGDGALAVARHHSGP
jgi:hypothetical protein